MVSLYKAYKTLKSSTCGFTLRNTLQLGRRNYQEPIESVDNCFSHRSNQAVLVRKEAQLIEEYELGPFCKHVSRTRYIETLTQLDVLDQLLTFQELNAQQLSISVGPQLNWLDVGCKNWAYVMAQYKMAQHLTEPLGQQFHLTGIELDGYRLYRNFFTRKAYAQAFIQHLPEAHYLLGDVMTHRGAYRIITWMLPFVFLGPHRQWGLPAHYFKPEAMLAHIISLLAPGGTLWLVNQGEMEAAEQAKLFQPWQDSNVLTVLSYGPLPASFADFKQTRYGWIAVKTSPYHPA